MCFVKPAPPFQLTLVFSWVHAQLCVRENTLCLPPVDVFFLVCGGVTRGEIQS